MRIKLIFCQFSVIKKTTDNIHYSMKDSKIILGIECYVKKDGKYLMLHRNINKKIMPGVWMAPGGKIESNEGIFECARREIMEETGLTIKNLKLRAVGLGLLKDIHTEMFFYLITADYAEGVLKQNDEDGKLVWLTKEEILKLDNLLAELYNVIPFILSNKEGVISYKASYEKGNEISEFHLEQP